MKIRKINRIGFSKFHFFIACLIILKITLMLVFSSEYQDRLFLPFVSDFVENGKNVYQSFFERGELDSFPYLPVMLYTQSIGAVAIKLFGVQNSYLLRFLFKLPSLIMDLVGLAALINFFPNKRRYIAVLYFCSPIILYAVYMHGQLDLIPMNFLIMALYFLVSKKSIKKRYIWASVFTAFALLSKLHILAVLPIIFFYLHKRDGLTKAFGFFALTFSIVIIGIIPFWSSGFKHMVLFNEQQNVLTQVSFHFASVEMYIPIVSVLFVYLLAFKIHYMNKELFLNLCGVVFSVFLAFCPPMPGWYVWIVPFMALFFASTNAEKYKNIFVYVVLNAFYLVYFIFCHHREYVDLFFLNRDMTFLKGNNEILSNIFFTVLSGILIYLFISMYRLGISSNNLYKRKNIPFTIGIAGDSGAGKSTMIDIIELGLGVTNLLYIEGDGDHRWERGNRFWDEYTSLNPKANYLYRQAEDLKVLRLGSAVRRVDYDHQTGKFTLPKRLSSKKYVILCGLHALYLPQTRKNLDLKIYMDSDETLRRFWKIRRDTARRGYSKEEVLNSIVKRIPDAKKYIYPQKDYADLTVHYYDKNLKDCMVEGYTPRISVRLRISATIDVEPLVEVLKHYRITVNYEYAEDLKTQVVDFDADDLEKIQLPVDDIARRTIVQLEELTREEWDKSVNAKDGIIILFLLLLISSKMQGGNE